MFHFGFRPSARSGWPAIGLAAFLFCWICPGLLEADNALHVSHARGVPGSRNIDVIVTATTDVAIHGYSVALSYPPDVLRLRGIGIDGTHVAELNPEFVAPNIDDQTGISTLAVIFDFNDPVSGVTLGVSGPADAPLIVAHLRFDVEIGAEGGLYPLRLVDGIGSPASYNRFTRAGESLIPTLEDGSFFVGGGNAIRVDKRMATAGSTQNLPIYVRAFHPQPLDGFSLAISYDCNQFAGDHVLLLNEATWTGTDLETKLGPGLVEFFRTDVDVSFLPTCRSRTVAVFDYTDPFNGQNLPAATEVPNTLLRLSFDVGGLADNTSQSKVLELSNLEIAGAINNQFLIDAQTVSPTREDGRVYFSLGHLRGRVVDKVTGAPLSNVLVETTTDGYSAMSDGDGRFEVFGMIPGEYTLVLDKVAYYSGLFDGIDVPGSNNFADAGDLAIYEIPLGGTAPFVRGDPNNDGRVNIADAQFILNWIFFGTNFPSCNQSVDANDDERTNIADPSYLLNFIFLGTPGPPAPSPDCGLDDATPGTLNCAFSFCNT